MARVAEILRAGTEGLYGVGSYEGWGVKPRDRATESVRLHYSEADRQYIDRWRKLRRRKIKLTFKDMITGVASELLRGGNLPARFCPTDPAYVGDPK